MRNAFPTTSALDPAALGESTRQPGLPIALAEIALVILPFVLARLIGHWLDFVYLGPIAVAAGAGIATWLLRTQGQTWKSLGLRRPASWRKTVLGVVATIVAMSIAGFVVIRPLLRLLDLGSPDVSALGVVQRDLLTFLIFLLPLSWGTAAFGEELIARGFILNRVATALGPTRRRWVGGLLAQAVIFGAAHSWQGVSGMLSTFILALVFGSAYLLAGRNLWVCILAHGLVDSVSIILIYTGGMDLMIG